MQNFGKGGQCNEHRTQSQHTIWNTYEDYIYSTQYIVYSNSIYQSV
jgi:hypothetical protein